MRTPESVRLVSLNTWKCDGPYSRRLQLMADGLLGLRPDVVLLQEVFASEDGRHDTAARIAEALSLTCFRAPSRTKIRSVEGDAVASSCGLAILSRFPFLQQHVLDLPTSLDDGDRIAQFAQLLVQDRPFWVVNLHLTHLEGELCLRRDQIDSIVNSSQRLAGDESIVIGGDFNAPIDSLELMPLFDSRLGFLDCFQGLPKRTHWTDLGQSLDIDHVLVGGAPSWKVRSASTTMCGCTNGRSETASDHAALVVDLSLVD